MRRPAGRPRYSFLSPVQSIFQNVTLGSVARLVANAGTSAAAGVFGITNQPVVDWVGAPFFVWAINDAAENWHFEAKENPLLEDYYSRVGFTNQLRFSHSAGDNTRTYFKAQLGYDFGLAAMGTTSIILGRIPSTGVGSQVLNTAVHAIPSATPMLQVGRMLRLRSAYSLDDDFQVWMRWIVGLKAGRVAYRAFLSTLPAYTPSVILEALAASGGVALVRGWAIGNYIEAMAQYIHFRAYDEQGWLTRANDCYVDRGPTGRPVLRFEDNARPALPFYQPNAGPASRTVEVLFYDDFRGHITNWRFVGDLLKEPCGWMAIAHKISQL